MGHPARPGPPYRVAVPLIDFQGNIEPMGRDPLVEASFTESRLGRVGAAVLAAERGDIPAVPMGLINGDYYAGGLRPSFPARRVIDALLALVADPARPEEDVLALLGPPVFPTGCDVDGDIDALLAGRPVELRLTPRMEIDTTNSPVTIDLTHFAPTLDAAACVRALSRFIMDGTENPRAVRLDDDRNAPPELAEVTDLSSSQTGPRLRVKLPLGSDPVAAVSSLRSRSYDFGGVMVPVQADLGAPAVEMLRRWAREHAEPGLAAGLERFAALVADVAAEPLREAKRRRSYMRR